jgi:hypothetical protein
MGRRLIPVNLDLLKQSIAKAEDNGPLATQNDVWNKAAEIYNSLPNIPEKITFSVVFLRAKENNFEIKTKSARGRKARGNMDPTQRPIKAPRDISPFPMTNVQENKKSVSNDDYFISLRKNTPERWHSVIDKIEKGSKIAAIKLNCVNCFGTGPGVADDIRNCTSKTCALYLFRPYQNKKNETNVVQENVEVESETIEPITISPEEVIPVENEKVELAF